MKAPPLRGFFIMANLRMNTKTIFIFNKNQLPNDRGYLFLAVDKLHLQKKNGYSSKIQDDPFS